MKKTYLPKAPEAPEANKPRRVFNTVPLEAHLARSSYGFDCLQLQEPALVFAGNRRCDDPRTGIAAYGPYFKTRVAKPHRLRVGIVGTTEGVEQCLRLLDGLSQPVEQDNSIDCVLHPSFPGFNTAPPFQVEVVAKKEWCRRIYVRDLIRAMESCDDPTVKRGLLQDCFGREVRELAQLESVPDVVLCAVTESLGDLLRFQPLGPSPTRAAVQSMPGSSSVSLEANSPAKFQIALNAESIGSIPTHAIPNEMLAPPPETDRATRAWDIALTLLQKAGLSSWRIADCDKGACHVGISFFRSHAGSSSGAWSSFAYALAETGDSFVVTGEVVARERIDRATAELHLDEKQSNALLAQVLTCFQDRTGSLPGKVVLHKASGYNDSERAGFQSALESVGKYALTTLTRRGVFVLRPGRRPVLRGTAIPFGEKLGLVFTSGYVPFLQCYPGDRLPQPFEIVENWGSVPFIEIASDLLRLTKLELSSPKFYSKAPAPYSCFRRVREILEVAGHKPRVIDGKFCL